MRKQNYFRVYNCIITDRKLYSSSKRVMSALLAYCSPRDLVRKSVEELAALSGCCVATVCKALAELEARGFIRTIRCYRTSRFISRPIYATSTYQIRRSKLSGGYTLVPRELLTAKITHSAFVTALYIYKTAGRRGRSWASLRNSSTRTDLSKATICRSLKALRLAQLICRNFCIKANRAFNCNSYYPTAWVRTGVQTVTGAAPRLSPVRGGLNFRKHLVINKLTGVYIKRKKEKGVFQFGDLYSFVDDLLRSGISPVLLRNTV